MVENLLEERISEVREVFTFFDKDCDGLIDTKDVIPVLRSAGLNPAEKDAIRLIERFDPNDTRSMDFATFLQLMVKISDEGDSWAEILEAFRAFDPTASGMVGTVEFRQIMASMGERLTPEEVNEFMRVADPGSRGEIKYEEFMEILFSNK